MFDLQSSYVTHSTTITLIQEDETPTKALVINRYMHLEVHMEITFVLQHTVNPMVEVLVVLLMGVLLEKKQTHAPYFQE